MTNMNMEYKVDDTVLFNYKKEKEIEGVITGITKNHYKIKNYSNDEKYMIKKRTRFPALKPYWNEYKGYVAWFMVGIGTHEVIHMVRDYED